MEKLTDSLISSINAIYLALFGLLVLYMFACQQHLERRSTFQEIAAIEKLMAMREIDFRPPPESEKISVYEAKSFFNRHRFKNSPIDEDGELTPSGKLEFETFVDNSSVIKNISMRLAPGAVCDVLAVRLQPGNNFPFLSDQVVGGVWIVKSEDITFLSFGYCGLNFNEELYAFVYRLTDKNRGILIENRWKSLSRASQLHILCNPSNTT